MVLTATARPPTTAGTLEPALIVPDASAWALWGEDLAGHGLVQGAAPAACTALVVPRVVPHELGGAVREAWSQLPRPRRVVELDGPALPGVPASDLLAEHDDEDEPAEEEHDHGDGHHEMDHEDMMEITGEPSRDGLVMESIEFEHGPLAAGLPGGLVLEAELDGDVVCSCTVRASLRPAREGGSTAVPDPLAPLAWTVALRRAGGEPLGGAAVASVECERALSHLSWLASFALVLGWDELSGRAGGLARRLIPAAAHLRAALAGAREADGRDAVLAAVDGCAPGAQRLLGGLSRSRRLRARARGRAVVTRAAAEAAGLAGPNARASGLDADTRADDARYRELGFEPRVQHAGDVCARVLQRAGEAVDALGLAARALRSRPEVPATKSAAAVEGPRGPLRTGRTDTGSRSATAPGSAAGRSLAGERATGLEWASALTAVVSFDLSPWGVAG